MPSGFRSYRHSLTRYDSALAYAVLGIIAGVLSGAVVIALEHGIEQLALLWGVAMRGDGFESLSAKYRFLLPFIGASVLGLLFAALRPPDREVGIVHVISRLHSSYGMLPWRNAVVQFFSAAFALATGQSGGREGPGVHLGAAATSLVGQALALPNNSLRVLIACGSAGGIAAAFNTPLAGVIFAMEVIISEYTLAGFMPVMLSAVAASVMSRQLGGGVEIFDMSSVHLSTLWEIPYIVLLGIICGTAVAMFIRISTLAATLAHWPVALRFALAGALTGTLGVFVPEVLGVGYDTLGGVLYGEIAITALLFIAAAKILATAVSVGFGMPIGLIAPNLLFGACIGGFVGSLGHALYPQAAADVILYATIGMAAAMGAALAAPLAASLAIIELTQSTSVAMPAMLAIVAAHLTNLTVFGQRSAHRSVLGQLERQLPEDPLNQLLHRTDVNAVIDGSVVPVDEMPTRAVASSLALQVPKWCLINRAGEDLFLVDGGDLMEWLEQNVSGELESQTGVSISESSLRRWSIAVVPEQATLRQTLDTLRNRTAEAVCVYSRSGSGRRKNRGAGKRSLRGVVTREGIERFTLNHLNS